MQIFEEVIFNNQTNILLSTRIHVQMFENEFLMELERFLKLLRISVIRESICLMFSFLTGMMSSNSAAPL